MPTKEHIKQSDGYPMNETSTNTNLHNSIVLVLQLL